MTSKEDLIEIYTRRAIFMEARKWDCNVILFGVNSTNVAIKALANTAKGKGMSLSDDISLECIENGIEFLKIGFVIARPLRDTLVEEIGFYNRFNNVGSSNHPSITTGMSKKVSIDRMTADFLAGLQRDFPSTVSTISKTAFKINSADLDGGVACVLCSRFSLLTQIY
jgi:cytoplasmic tRNA 2-thiolation protein 2